MTVGKSSWKRRTCGPWTQVLWGISSPREAHQQDAGIPGGHDGNEVGPSSSGRGLARVESTPLCVAAARGSERGETERPRCHLCSCSSPTNDSLPLHPPASSLPLLSLTLSCHPLPTAWPRPRLPPSARSVPSRRQHMSSPSLRRRIRS